MPNPASDWFLNEISPTHQFLEHNICSHYLDNVLYRKFGTVLETISVGSKFYRIGRVYQYLTFTCVKITPTYASLLLHLRSLQTINYEWIRMCKSSLILPWLFFERFLFQINDQNHFQRVENGTGWDFAGHDGNGPKCLCRGGAFTNDQGHGFEIY